MIREERDPAFWQRIADHPEVAPAISLGRAVDLSPLIASPHATPLAAEHGGFIIVRLSVQIAELHTLFTPEGWGREVAAAAREMNAYVFASHQVLVTFEVEGNWRSRPPKSHGWSLAGDFEPTEHATLRSWVLTRAAWRGSPVFRRL